MFKQILASALVIGGLWLGSSVNPAQAYDVPDYDGYVNDFADILSEEVEEQLEADLKQTADASNGAEIAVATIQSLNGEPIENVAIDFFDAWGIGKADLDNGVLLLIAVDDRELRIEVGYGAEPVITDSEAGRIIRNIITPEFKAGDYEGGVTAGVTAIKDQFSASPGFNPSIDPINKSSSTISNFLSVISAMFAGVFFVSIFIYLASWFGRTKEWWPGGLVGLGLGLLFGNIAAAIFFGLFGLFLDYVLSKNYKQLKKMKKSTGWKKTWGGFSSGSSGGGWSSGGGSSFGGGSSGGGGASGGW